jgi:protein gp37
MNKTKIEWCDVTLNPVIGCVNNCIYCYAKKINNRFKFIPDWQTPTFFDKKLLKQFPKKPSRIFVNSMSDIYYWKDPWMEKVIDKIKQHPQHRFIFLTKFPQAYEEYNFPNNCLLGVTITNQEQLENIRGYFQFVSLEPLQTYIEPLDLPYMRWIILGAESGNRKDKIIPKLEWIQEIVDYCKCYKVPLFMKNNLKEVWKGDLIQEFPEDLK